MEANIQAIVNDLHKVTLDQIIFEAIMNSIQANAIRIEIKIFESSLFSENNTPYIDKIEIIDNGDGFNEINTKSFQQYRTTYKQKKFGSKGIGRFLYLKLFNKIKINSLDKNILFSIVNDVEIQKSKQKYKNTSVIFESPKNNLFINIDKLEQNIKDSFLPYFSLLNNEIKIIISTKQKSVEINSKNIPKLNSEDFKIKEHLFNIKYVLNNDKIKYYDGFYCANNRVVLKNSELDNNIKINAFKDVNILFLISSEYLDSNVNDERDDFSIFPSRVNTMDIFGDLSWNDIKVAITKQLKSICLKNNIDIEKRANKYLDESIQKAPYLAYYLRENQNEYGYKSDALINQAKKRLELDKKILRETKSEENEEYQKKLAMVTQSELAEYIFDRQAIIDKLKELTDQESLEDNLHSLFMKPKTKDEQGNYKTNSLWLFDDRFMSYDKVFSDKQINEIFPKLLENRDRPDILSINDMRIISNTYEKEEITDIVIIELKKASKITPARAEEQLIDYAGYINEAYEDRKIRIWTYAFLKFNDKIEKSLDNKDYNKVFTKSKYPIYYKPFNKVNTIINFVDYYAIADDAHNRNKTFMKILSGDNLKNEEK